MTQLQDLALGIWSTELDHACTQEAFGLEKEVNSKNDHYLCCDIVKKAQGQGGQSSPG